MPKSTKNQIMNALAELLQTKRLDDITVTELVEQCGLSRQAFYYHFSDLYGVVDYGIQQLLDGLGVAGKLIWCWIQISVRVALWSMLFVIPGLIAAYRYRFAYYNILTDGSLSASEAIALSCRQTAGMKMDLFVLDLSFIGWEIVSNLTYGLLNIWLMPYKTLAELAYFEEGQRRVGRSPYGGASGGQSGTPWEF